MNLKGTNLLLTDTRFSAAIPVPRGATSHTSKPATGELGAQTPQILMRSLFLLILPLIATVVFPTPARAQRPINIAEPANGGKVVYYSEPGKLSATRFLIDKGGRGLLIWTSGKKAPPFDFVFSFKGMCQASITRVDLQGVRGRPITDGTQVKDFKIEVSQSSPVEGFRTVGQFELTNAARYQAFELPPNVKGRFLKIRVLSNHGGSITNVGGGIRIIGNVEGAECVDTQADAAITTKVKSTDEMRPVDRMEEEANDSISTANTIRTGESIGGLIERSGEVDFFSLRLKPEERGIVNLTLESRPFLRTDMELLDKNGKVLNRIGRSNVLGLKKSYSLALNGEQYFFRLFQPGMSIVLLVDNSGSMKGRENELRRAVEQFVSERNGTDRVAILNFAGGPTQLNIPQSMISNLPKALRDKVAQTFAGADVCSSGNSCKPLGGGVGQLTDFTSDQAALKVAAANSGKAFGGTPLNHAMMTAFEKLKSESGNKAILLFTDGADTASQAEYSKVWQEITKDQGIRIYTVGLGQALLQPQMIGVNGRELLRHWSIATHGRSFFTTEAAKLTEFYSQISREISEATRYRLEIGSAKGKGTLDVIAQGERLPAEVTSRRVEMIFDASGSMQAKVGTKTRIEIAKEVVRDLIEKLPENTEIGMRVFGHRRKGDCKDIQMVAPFAKLNKAKLTSQVNSINAIGITPLAASLRLAGEDMASYSGDTTLIVLTDGNEQCRGNPVAEVRKLQREGIDVNLHIIGFAVDQDSVRQLNEIAKAGGGQFHKASDAKELVSALRTSLGARFEVRDATGKVVAKGVTGAKNLQLTEGFYRVVIKSDPEIEVKDVYIKKGETTAVIVTKEGNEINTEVREP